MSEKKPTPKKKLRPDVNEVAHRVMLEATGQAPKTVPPSERAGAEKDAEAVARGSKGGRKGGKARAKTLSAKERSEAARKAAQKRWEKIDASD